MNMRIGLSAVVLAICLPTFGTAAESMRVGWSDLLPSGVSPTWQKIGPAPSAATHPPILATELGGKTVELSGYLLPADREGELVYSFMLVPRSGACSHMVQPPPAQMVRVVPKEPYRLSMNYEAVSVTGKLTLGLEKTQIFILDGPAVVESGYTIRMAQVAPDTVSDRTASPAEGRSPWSFIDNPHAAGTQAADPAGSLSSTR
ncbi:DUF3299 domain-containing protein [Nitratireductor luteus]|uniref:DUF3299 domain-containing protein n=1 Tax=Nitratireductor luteus TaxID=2976980 RepID=UPI00223E993E|nr:DUF3299 domain-containing protein [Nitratireductor luteus]